MSALKTELRAAAIHEVGVKLEDALESARADEFRSEGGINALLRVSKRIEALVEHVNHDVDEEKYDLETAKLIKSYLARAAVIVDATTKEEADARLRTQGARMGYKRAVEMTHAMHQAETRKFVSQVSEPSPQSDVTPNGHVHLSIKEQRLAEDTATLLSEEGLADGTDAG